MNLPKIPFHEHVHGRSLIHGRESAAYAMPALNN
jgi:hypothetical protein